MDCIAHLWVENVQLRIWCCMDLLQPKHELQQSREACSWFRMACICLDTSNSHRLKVSVSDF